MTAFTTTSVPKLQMYQQQIMAPYQQRALRLLQLSSLDFLQDLQRTAESNPFLEIEEQEYLEYQETKQGSAVTYSHIQGLNSHRMTDDSLSSLPERHSLHDHLSKQLNMLHLSAREKFIALFIVNALDDDGYLRINTESLQADLLHLCLAESIRPLAHKKELERAILTIQSLEPTGVGSRTVQECLYLQLINLPSSPVQHLASLIVKDHFPDLRFKHEVQF